jgi:hypothetical protein
MADLVRVTINPDQKDITTIENEWGLPITSLDVLMVRSKLVPACKKTDGKYCHAVEVVGKVYIGSDDYESKREASQNPLGKNKVINLEIMDEHLNSSPTVVGEVLVDFSRTLLNDREQTKYIYTPMNRSEKGFSVTEVAS